ncbi:MAG: hypothetical protein ABSC06_01590 [Rhodopila sp.]|jgi:hypothetical protein
MRRRLCAFSLVALINGAALAAGADVPEGMVEHVTNLTAVVESVDLKDRSVLLRVPDGLVTVEVGPEVRNLTQIKVGDRVTIGMRQALVARLTTPNDASMAEIQSESLTAKPGARPAGFSRKSIRANVHITGIDKATNTVQFVGPAGVSRVAHIEDPSLQSLLQKLQVGDVVEMTYSIALAVRVTPVTSQ